MARKMKFINSIPVILSGLLYQSNIALSEDPPLPPWYPLKPWEVSSFYARSPRVGPYGTNATTLEITISNPSLIPAGRAPHASGGGYIVFSNSTAHCLTHWKFDDRTPYGNTKDVCTAQQSGGTRADWNITINEIQGAPYNYMDLSFTLVYNLHAVGSDFYKLLGGNVRLQPGQQLEGGCDENDICSYTLKNGTAPLLIQPTLAECRYACG
ncbi:hypothetical protein F5Y11DRAFT_325994 [Daldinia sp. FL1419]|nr:hypothetical protein F5Y11DRAFT_325994 [Daldinia sp. FL1419]